MRHVLLVEADSQLSSTISKLLEEAGYEVTTLRTFEEAVRFAAESRPDLVIAGVRLGRYNGLHLAIRFGADYPSLPVIVLGHENDVVLAAEAIQHRARFVPSNTPASRLAAFVGDILEGRQPRDLVSTRRWTRRPSSLPVQRGQTTGWVVDVGYGGMRVECTTPMEVGAPVDLDLPSLGLHVKGLFRWAKRSDDDKSWLCGFEIDSVSSDTRKWRRIVDSVKSAH